ncbi:uncharacterized protein C3orf38 homolog [Babylonia areolata]|uniref:uncharacterized protein C3orf38 homolog n=1 Tax=Babylonia areolata TaxID=304850 RepID=UPI003FD5BAC4
MLVGKEKEGCFRLLGKLTTEEILSLKNTITNRLIASENRDEAVKAILEYSESAVELLRRKKMRRDLLFQYLADCNVVVPVNAEKSELIRHVLEFWGSSVSSNYDLVDADSTTRVVAAAAPSPEQSKPTMQQLGETFARWFYQLLNTENPSCDPASAVEGTFGPHHFWENCTLKVVTCTPDKAEESYEGNVLVAQRLQALAREEQLLFNPNISTDGVQVQSNPHGLVIVMVCGTVHQHNHCLGVFEQVFGLISDPLNENTWKVKVTQLHLSSSRVTALPRLSDDSARELLSVMGPMSVALRS